MRRYGFWGRGHKNCHFKVDIEGCGLQRTFPLTSSYTEPTRARETGLQNDNESSSSCRMREKAQQPEEQIVEGELSINPRMEGVNAFVPRRSQKSRRAVIDVQEGLGVSAVGRPSNYQSQQERKSRRRSYRADLTNRRNWRGEAFELLQLQNSGHLGTTFTIDAYSAEEDLASPTKCVLQGGVELLRHPIKTNIAASLTVVVHVERRPGGRYTSEVLLIRRYDMDAGHFDYGAEEFSIMELENMGEGQYVRTVD
ncbi:MAG: P-loop NTPase family protein [Candidatus Acidiferrales bacterium]